MEPTEEDLMRGFTGIVMNGPFERRGPPQTFRDTFVSLPWTATDRADASELDMTAKINLPITVLARVSRMNVPFPLTFRIFNEAKNTFTTAGAPEFDAECDGIVMPYWMMKKLELDYMEPVQIETVSLPVGRKVVIQGYTSDYAEMQDLRHEMEKKMRDFPCLSQGDTIFLNSGGEPQMFTVLEVFSDEGPCDSISCLNTDLKVEFERPLDCPPTPLANQPGYDHPFGKVGDSDGEEEESVVQVSKSGFQYFAPLDEVLFKREEETISSLPPGVQVLETNKNVNLPEGFKFFSGQGRRLGK